VVEWFFPTDDDIGELAAGQNELRGHRPDGRVILQQDAFASAAAFDGIALDAAAQTLVSFGGHEDFQVEQRADFFVRKSQDSFENQKRLRFHAPGHVSARVLIEEVDRLIDGLTADQRFEMGAEQFPIEGVGVIVIQLRAFGETKVRLRMVVRIERKDFGFAAESLR
jgi:hypothetical protein